MERLGAAETHFPFSLVSNVSSVCLAAYFFERADIPIPLEPAVLGRGLTKAFAATAGTVGGTGAGAATGTTGAAGAAEAGSTKGAADAASGAGFPTGGSTCGSTCKAGAASRRTSHAASRAGPTSALRGKRAHTIAHLELREVGGLAVLDLAVDVLRPALPRDLDGADATEAVAVLKVERMPEEIVVGRAHPSVPGRAREKGIRCAAGHI